MSCFFLLATVLSFRAAPPIPAPRPEATPGLVARSVGPGIMGGRITSLAVPEGQSRIWYVAAASGGIWKTSDQGQAWQCVFSGRPNASVGAVAVAPSDADIVYVGTGEANMRNSVSWGNGVFLSRDAGQTWVHVGLEQTHHIGRIAVHPKDPDTAFVAAVGRGWGANPQRGLFRTRNAGKSWEHVLKLDDDTGCIDVLVDPSDPQIVHAAAYRVRRGPFSGGNPETQFGKLAGLYRSSDGGSSFRKITNGLPARPYGRCGLALYRKDPRILYAVIQTDMTDASRLVGQPSTRPGQPLGATDTGGVFRSDDRGVSWRKVNDFCPRPFYFGKIRIDPNNSDNVWVLGIPLAGSRDAGKTFRSVAPPNVHVDHHALWIDPADSRRMLLGNDGGLYDSTDGGKSWQHVRNLPIGQFYGIAVDTSVPYRIYGGLQDNGTWGGPSRSDHPQGIVETSWRRILGMDGFQCASPGDDPQILYCQGQYGRLFRADLRMGRNTSIRPPAVRGQAPHRFNWSSPLVLSPHDSKTLYYGGNVVFRSSDRGQSWRIISPDLTRGVGGVTYRNAGHTLTALSESPVKAGVLWAGSDDGRVHVSSDAGKTWTDVSSRVPGLPRPTAPRQATASITRLEPSPTRADSAYLAFSRHRQDDTRLYLLRTRDEGRSWQSITVGLPAQGPAHVIRADPQTPGLLFVGTEFGLYVSFDEGDHWQRFECGVPSVAVHDLVIHPRDRELVIATHGRGLYVVDIAPLQQLTAAVRAQKTHLFPTAVFTLGKPAQARPVPQRSYLGENPPAGVPLTYRLGEKLDAPGTLSVLDSDGQTVASWPTPTAPGIHRRYWQPSGGGDYVLRLQAGGEKRERKLTVRSPGS